MNIYGYCRISTAKQSIDRQIRNIKAEYPTAHIVQEAYTGTSIFRPEWLKLYRVLKAGDTVVFDSVSRMSRNAEEGFALYPALFPFPLHYFTFQKQSIFYAFFNWMEFAPFRKIIYILFRACQLLCRLRRVNDTLSYEALELFHA